MYTYTKHCLFDFSREMFISYNYSSFKTLIIVLLHNVQVNGTPHLHLWYISTLLPQDTCHKTLNSEWTTQV